MIVHIFTAERYHLVPALSLSFAKLFPDFDQLFVLRGTRNLKKNLYDNQFKEIEFENYQFCTSNKEFFKIIKDHKDDAILFHCGDYRVFLRSIILGCKNLNWVCWGEGTTIGNGLKSKIASKIRKYTYTRLSSIVTLMMPDAESIHDNFNVDKDKIKTLPYFSSRSEYDYLYDSLLNYKRENTKPVVLMGNSPWCMKSYLNLLPMLEKFKGRITVRCMLNYSLEKNEDYYKLLELGHSIFDKDFQTCEEFYSDFKEYLNFMNSCDIYICGAEDQNGLGAINNCLRLRKKIYLTGKNLNWIRAKGHSVCDIKDLSTIDIDSFLEKVSDEEFSYNNEVFENNKKKSIRLWREYLCSI